MRFVLNISVLSFVKPRRPAVTAATAATAAQELDPTSRVSWDRAAIPEGTVAEEPRRPRR